MAQISMHHWSRKLGAALLVLAAVAACTPAASPTASPATSPAVSPADRYRVAAHVKVGVADSDAATFESADWPALKVRDARAVAPWDVALQERDGGTPGGKRRLQLERWLEAAAHVGAQPVVTFELSAGRRDAPPTLEAYRHAMSKFRETYPKVMVLGAWNEPNDRGLASWVPDPALAAGYWATLQEVCRTCTVLAGEFAGIPGNAYVKEYVGHMRARETARLSFPAVWSFHDHTDVNRFQANVDQSAPAARYLLAALPATARVWITEAGAYYRNAKDEVFDEASHARAVSFLLGLTTLDARIEAMFYYNFANDCPSEPCPHQDRGLISPMPADGPQLDYDQRARRRCAFGVIAARGPYLLPAASRGEISRGGAAPAC